MRFHASLLLLAGIAGCGFDEKLPEIDIQGKVIIPRAAATRNVVDTSGDIVTLTDDRFIGPVYLGAFPDVREGYFPYPHPEMGPIVGELDGNTYPYGGTSVGRFAFACFEALVCRVSTGRFVSFDEIIEYFTVFAQDPIVDPSGDEVTSGAYFEQYCLDYFYYTSLQEFDFLAIDDEGKPAPDFTENADGDFEAEFTMSHTPFYEGMKLWGWVDTPSEVYEFSTCNPNLYGPAMNEYNQEFNAGGGQWNVLNYPGSYIFKGDWVVSEAWQMNSREDEPTLKVDFKYE
jgi:hypothetical protein